MTARRKSSGAKKEKIGVDAWSFSRLQTYESCPGQIRYRIQGFKEEKGAPLLRGSAIHKVAENFLKSTGTDVPEELAQFADEFLELRSRPVLSVEEQWAFDSQWRITGWFNDDCWLRMKVDAYAAELEENFATAIDFKTGKIRESHEEQLELYALGAFCRDESLERVCAENWYLDHGELHENVIERARVPALKKKWTKRPARMLADKRLDPKPCGLCRYCSFSKTKDGPCTKG